MTTSVAAAKSTDRTAAEHATLPPGSWATTAAVRKSMRSNRSRDTKPELAVRRAAHALGLRYRVDSRPLPGVRCRADMIFIRSRLAVFIDGCWWHGCQLHHRPPSANADYWAAKIARNIERDQKVDEMLAEAGWRVMRVWEHEDPVQAAERLAAAVRQPPH